MLFYVFIFLAVSVTHIFTEYAYKTIYVDVPLDHFAFNGNRTFKLRVLVNDTYWKNKKYGPIFFYTGNEGSIEMFAKNTGFLWESAKRFKALVVFAEHRYYGVSLPFGNLSLTDAKYFGYLTSQQALADFVDVIYYLKSGKWIDGDSPEQEEEHIYRRYPNRRKGNPVVAFGGSYGGMLAAWFRMKYPAVVEGALASSAPIWQFTGMTSCNAFYEIVTSSYASTSYKECVPSIKKSWEVITNFSYTSDSRKWLSDKWRLCNPLASADDVKILKEWVEDVYISVAMTDYPYSTNFLMPLPPNPVKVLCSFLNNSSSPDEQLLESIFNAISVYFNGTGSVKCLNYLRDASPDLGANGWNIQTCMEMVMPLCSNGKQDMFEPDAWNFEGFSNACYKKYGVKPVVDYVEKQYGGKDIRTASNIIFSNGLLDPWSGGGVLCNVSSSTYTVVIPESAHHLDLRASNPKDPQSVRKARFLYKQIFRKWLRDYYKSLGFQSHPNGVSLEEDGEDSEMLLKYYYKSK